MFWLYGSAALAVATLAWFGAAWADDATAEDSPVLVRLVITTHNPACTAAFLNGTGVTRVTDVLPHYRDGVYGYSEEEVDRGISVTAVVWHHEYNMTIGRLAERPEVSGVAAYPYRTSIPALAGAVELTGGTTAYGPAAQNATSPESLALVLFLATAFVTAAANATSPEPLAVYSDVEKSDFDGFYSPCRPMYSLSMLELVMDSIGWPGAGPGARPASEPIPSLVGTAGVEGELAPLTLDTIRWEDLRIEQWIIYYGDLIGVSIDSYNVNATWAYLQENGALVTYVSGAESLSGGGMLAYVPVPLLWPIWDREEVSNIVTLTPPRPVSEKMSSQMTKFDV